MATVKVPPVTDVTVHQSYFKQSTVKKVKFSLHLIKHKALNIRLCGTVKVKLHAFLTLALNGGNLSARFPGRFIPREKNRC
jgi:hypothetical protein